MEINRTNIFDLLFESSIRPDKDYGQNFLLEPDLAKKIVEALECSINDNVLEIGPGLGSLTHFLYKICNLTVCDIDSRMIDFLKIFYKDDISFILNDVRKVDVSFYDKIIGNLPYNITTELVLFLLINATKAERMVLMCQLEAFDRFNDLSGEKYGPASILIHLLGEVKKVMVVKPGCFHPVPKCNSVVFTFKRIRNNDFDSVVGTYKMACSLFLNRRKTIYNNLKNYLGNSEQANELLNALEINQLDRPENIKPEIYLKMYLLIQK